MKETHTLHLLEYDDDADEYLARLGEEMILVDPFVGNAWERPSGRFVANKSDKEAAREKVGATVQFAGTWYLGGALVRGKRLFLPDEEIAQDDAD